jgi:hypothetical protein
MFQMRRAMILPLLAAALSALAQTPEALLSNLSPEYQAWVNRSCPKSLGPSLWNSCVGREVGALSGGVPDLSQLRPDDRNWLLRSCPSTLGPSLAISCLNRELQALAGGMPSLSMLPPDKRAWVEQACPKSLGPALYRSCINREASAAAGTATPPTSEVVPPPPISNSPAPRRPRPAAPSRRAQSYAVEVSHNDELFIINGEKFEAQTYCFNMEEGDPVIFLEGNPFGACASAVILNLRTKEKCDVWCQ